MRIALLGDFDTYLFRGVERPPALGQYRLSPGLNLARGFRELGVKDLHFLVCTPEVQQVAIDEGPFGTLHRVPQPKFSGSSTFFLWRRHLLLRQLKRIAPDIVHGQGTEEAYALTAVTSPYPHVITFHGIISRVHEIEPPPFFSLSHAARFAERIVARKARHVISISQEVENFLQRQRSRAITYRIPNAMAPCFFEARPARDPSHFNLLYVGAIQPRKGLLYLIEAFASAQPRLGRELRLRVIGPAVSGADAAYGESVRTRAAELKVAERIEWLGVQREPGVAQALAASDVLVLPSFWENMPMCIGESMAAGVPVISTRAAGIPDWVEHGKTGLLVAPGKSNELADALVQLLSDPALSQKLVTAAQAKARAEYAPQVVAQKTLAVYEKIC
jgi:glycosyltransferase involved in cell wall biosynthesis